MTCDRRPWRPHVSGPLSVEHGSRQPPWQLTELFHQLRVAANVFAHLLGHSTVGCRTCRWRPTCPGEVETDGACHQHSLVSSLPLPPAPPRARLSDPHPAYPHTATHERWPTHLARPARSQPPLPASPRRGRPIFEGWFWVPTASRFPPSQTAASPCLWKRPST